MARYEKPDAWSLRAQKEGYPARSVYKLKEMDEKFRLIPPRGRERIPGKTPAGNPEETLQGAPERASTGRGFRVLDLGAAPGSWSLYTLRRLAGAGFLAAADLSPLSRRYDQGLFDGENFFFVRGDITAPEIRKTLLEQGPYRLVICDAAPPTTGSRQVDTLRSLELAETALGYAEEALESGGNLVVKIFQGGDAAALLTAIRGLFDSGRAFKPAACRRESFEVYYLGLGRKRVPGAPRAETS
ncbi:MAG: RlmE family RNA methyltransferase [Treponema sp.]|jgi:23S rRNA (uridine2552-2'-O)-methyltransferase|nr:RlmE family RNA methyltransferase [Treponema sp.]